MPPVCPPSRPFSNDGRRESKSRRASLSLRASASAHFRTSPGGKTPSSSRSYPELPPLSNIVTTALTRSQGFCLRPPSKLGRPVPPPKQPTVNSRSCMFRIVAYWQSIAHRPPANRVRTRTRRHTTCPRPDAKRRARLAPHHRPMNILSNGNTCRRPSSLGEYLTARALFNLNTAHKATAAPAITSSVIHGVRLACVPCHASALHVVEPSIPTSRPAPGLLAAP